jgi:hypothetical protein
MSAEALYLAETLMTDAIHRKENFLKSAYPHADTTLTQEEVARLRYHRQVIRQLASRYVCVAPLETDRAVFSEEPTKQNAPGVVS